MWRRAALTGEPVTLADGVAVDALSERRVGRSGAGGLPDGCGQPAATDLVRPVGHGAGHRRRPGWHVSPIPACPPTAVAWSWRARCRATPTSGCWTAPARAGSRSMRRLSRVPSGRPTAPGSCSARTGRVQVTSIRSSRAARAWRSGSWPPTRYKTPTAGRRTVASCCITASTRRRTPTSGSCRWWAIARRRCS